MQEPRPQQLVHGAQGVARRGRRARVPDAQPVDRGDRGQAPRQGPPRQALFPPRPLRQVRAHRGKARAEGGCPCSTRCGPSSRASGSPSTGCARYCTSSCCSCSSGCSSPPASPSCPTSRTRRRSCCLRRDSWWKNCRAIRWNARCRVRAASSTPRPAYATLWTWSTWHATTTASRRWCSTSRASTPRACRCCRISASPSAGSGRAARRSTRMRSPTRSVSTTSPPRPTRSTSTRWATS